MATATETNVNYKFVALNDKEADKAIKSINVKGAALRKLIHETACGLVMHMIEHGRHTKFIALADAIGNTLGKNQKNAFIKWVLAYTHLAWDEEQKNFIKDADKTNDLEEAKVKPFWSMEKEADDRPFDIQKAVTNLLRQARAKLEAGKFEGDPALIDSIEATFKNHTPVEAPKAKVIKAPKAKKTVKNDGPAPVEA